MKRKDFQVLAALRLKEAKILLQAGCWEGAYYLAGYAAECALKACIAKKTERHDFPDRRRVNDSYTHDMQRLATLANLDSGLKQAQQLHPELNANWTIVRTWGEESRYEKPAQADAEELVRAIAEPRHGVLQWLRLHW